MKKKSVGEKIWGIIVCIILIAFCISIIYPVMHVIAVSFSDNNYVMRGDVGIFPKGFTLAAYEYMMEFNLISAGYKNSIFILVVGTSINLILTSLTAYGLSKKDLIGRKICMSLIIFTMMFNGGLIPNYMLVRSLGLIDTLWAVILPGAMSAYNLIIMKNFFEALPEELLESARVDGLSEMGILIKIVAPLSKAVFSTIGLFYAVVHWNSYFNATIYINSKEKWPLQVVLRDILYNANTASMNNVDLGTQAPVEPLKMAIIVVVTAPILIMYPFIQKYFERGVMIGAIKG